MVTIPAIRPVPRRDRVLDRCGALKVQRPRRHDKPHHRRGIPSRVRRAIRPRAPSERIRSRRCEANRPRRRRSVLKLQNRTQMSKENLADAVPVRPEVLVDRHRIGPVVDHHIPVTGDGGARGSAGRRRPRARA